MNDYKDLVEEDIKIIDIEVRKAKYHIALFEYIASKENDKKKKAEVLLKAETLKDTIKKNEMYKTMVSEFLTATASIPTPFPTSGDNFETK
jgi:hypothetical protein